MTDKPDKRSIFIANLLGVVLIGVVVGVVFFYVYILATMNHQTEKVLLFRKVENSLDKSPTPTFNYHVQRYEDGSARIEYKGITCKIPAFDSPNDDIVCR